MTIFVCNEIYKGTNAFSLIFYCYVRETRILRVHEHWRANDQCECKKVVGSTGELTDHNMLAPDFSPINYSGKEGLNRALILVTSYYGHKSECWKPPCCLLG